MENYVAVNDTESKNVTVSIGCTIVNDGNRGIDLLFKEADEALYDAKKTGRNKVVVYSQTN